MNIDILGYNIDLEILILIGIIYLIMVVHTLISVTQVEGVNEIIKEGFEALTQRGDRSDNKPSSKYKVNSPAKELRKRITNHQNNNNI